MDWIPCKEKLPEITLSILAFIFGILTVIRGYGFAKSFTVEIAYFGVALSISVGAYVIYRYIEEPKTDKG